MDIKSEAAMAVSLADLIFGLCSKVYWMNRMVILRLHLCSNAMAKGLFRLNMVKASYFWKLLKVLLSTIEKLIKLALKCEGTLQKIDKEKELLVGCVKSWWVTFQIQSSQIFFFCHMPLCLVIGAVLTLLDSSLTVEEEAIIVMKKLLLEWYFGRYLTKLTSCINNGYER